MKRRKYSISIVLWVIQILFCSVSSAPSLFDSSFSRSTTNETVLNLSSCQSTKLLCDPDHVLPMQDPNTEHLQQYLQQKGRRCYPHSKTNGQSICVQMNVVIVPKMKHLFLGMVHHKDRSHRAAREFKDFLLQSWKNGTSVVDPAETTLPSCNSLSSNHKTTMCTRTADPAAEVVILFVSCHDRVWIIARSEALTDILTDARIEILVRNIQQRQHCYRKIPVSKRQQQQQQQPPIQLRDCSAATVMEIIRGVEFLLEIGKPPLWERIRDWYGPCLVHGLFFIIATLVAYMENRNPSDAKDVPPTLCLSVEERIRAEQLQQKFQNQWCPICYESFQTHPDGGSENSVIRLHRIGSDGKPVQLLRCGHILDATCWSEWTRFGIRAVRRQRCPICRETVF